MSNRIRAFAFIALGRLNQYNSLSLSNSEPVAIIAKLHVCLVSSFRQVVFTECGPGEEVCGSPGQGTGDLHGPHHPEQHRHHSL